MQTGQTEPTLKTEEEIIIVQPNKFSTQDSELNSYSDIVLPVTKQTGGFLTDISLFKQNQNKDHKTKKSNLMA